MSAVLISLKNQYSKGEGESGRRWPFLAAEESPPTHRARSRTQVRVARVTVMAQKRHGLFSVMKRSRR